MAVEWGRASFSKPYIASPLSQLIIQPFRRFTYVTAHSTSLPLLHLRRGSFSNPSAALPTSQLSLQSFRCFTYVIGTSHTSPGEPHMPLWWCLLCSWWFCYLQWLRPAGLYERCKLALELKRLKTPELSHPGQVPINDIINLLVFLSNLRVNKLCWSPSSQQPLLMAFSILFR